MPPDTGNISLTLTADEWQYVFDQLITIEQVKTGGTSAIGFRILGQLMQQMWLLYGYDVLKTSHFGTSTRPLPLDSKRRVR